MSKSNITAHMVVKNEDQWVRYSLLSILPYVDTVLITDTGSSDHTLQAIKSIASPKIKLTKTTALSASAVTSARQQQLSKTQTDWIWVIDGDEIYPHRLAEEIVDKVESGLYEGMVVRRYDLLGDLYHRQVESVGQYQLFGQRGHLVTRLLNQRRIKGLHYRGDYPNEGFFDHTNTSTRSRDPKKWYITTNSLFHTMYLRRSSLGRELPMINRQKYRYELGLPVSTPVPDVFAQHPPMFWEGTPLSPRPLGYSMIASLITPIKTFKRTLFD